MFFEIATGIHVTPSVSSKSLRTCIQKPTLSSLCRLEALLQCTLTRMNSGYSGHICIPHDNLLIQGAFPIVESHCTYLFVFPLLFLIGQSLRVFLFVHKSFNVSVLLVVLAVNRLLFNHHLLVLKSLPFGLVNRLFLAHLSHQLLMSSLNHHIFLSFFIFGLHLHFSSMIIVPLANHHVSLCVFILLLGDDRGISLSLELILSQFARIQIGYSLISLIKRLNLLICQLSITLFFLLLEIVTHIFLILYWSLNFLGFCLELLLLIDLSHLVFVRLLVEILNPVLVILLLSFG